MDDFTFQLIVLGGVLPGSLTFAGALSASLLPEKYSEASRRIVTATGLALALLAAAVALPWLPPRNLQGDSFQQTWHWLLIAAAVATILDLLTLIPKWPTWLSWGLFAGLAATASWLLLPTTDGFPEVQQSYPAYFVAMLGTITIAWCVHDRLAITCVGRSYPWLILAAIAAAIYVIQLCSFAKLLQIAGVLAACTTAIALVSLWKPWVPVMRSLVPAVAVLVPGTMMLGKINTWSNVPYSCLIGAYLALVLGIVGEWQTLTKEKPLLRVALHWLWVLLPIAFTLIAAYTWGDAGSEPEW